MFNDLTSHTLRKISTQTFQTKLPYLSTIHYKPTYWIALAQYRSCNVFTSSIMYTIDNVDYITFIGDDTFLCHLNITKGGSTEKYVVTSDGCVNKLGVCDEKFNNHAWSPNHIRHFFGDRNSYFPIMNNSTMAYYFEESRFKYYDVTSERTELLPKCAVDYDKERNLILTHDSFASTCSLWDVRFIQKPIYSKANIIGPRLFHGYLFLPPDDIYSSKLYYVTHSDLHSEQYIETNYKIYYYTSWDYDVSSHTLNMCNWFAHQNTIEQTKYVF